MDLEKVKSIKSASSVLNELDHNIKIIDSISDIWIKTYLYSHIYSNLLALSRTEFSDRFKTDVNRYKDVRELYDDLFRDKLIDIARNNAIKINGKEVDIDVEFIESKVNGYFDPPYLVYKSKNYIIVGLYNIIKRLLGNAITFEKIASTSDVVIYNGSVSVPYKSVIIRFPDIIRLKIETDNSYSSHPHVIADYLSLDSYRNRTCMYVNAGGYFYFIQELSIRAGKTIRLNTDDENTCNIIKEALAVLSV